MISIRNVILPAVLFLGLLTGHGCSQTHSSSSITTNTNYTSNVNLFIGTDGVGNTHPGAVLPWGMAALSPQTYDFTGMQLATGYRQGQGKIYGFSSINLSGVGCPGAGSVPFKFSSGAFNPEPIGSSYANENASPGFYSVDLVDENIKVSATATKRSGLYKVDLPVGQSQVYIDLTAQQGHIKGGTLDKHSNSMASGYQLEGFFCGSTNRLKIFFYAELDQAADTTYLIYRNTNNQFDQNLIGQPSGIVYQFNNSTPSTVQVKVGVSFVSSDNAKLNLDTEQTDFEFNQVQLAANQSWESELSKIKVESDDSDDLAVFYTSLYHSLLMPITFSDVNGAYVKQGSKEIAKANYTRYTAFSLWDTYRTTHPLFALAYPAQQLDMVKTMVGMYHEAGRLPKWEIFATETNIMVGDPAAIVIGDTYMKGITQFDTLTAYEAMVKQATVVKGNYMRRGLEEYLNLGYISMDGPYKDVTKFEWFNGIVWGPVSTTMEFNLADFNIAQMAKSMGKKEDYQKFLDQSMSFVKLYDPQTQLIRPKNKDGSWYTPFDPAQGLWDQMRFGLRGGPGFVEGSAWQYLFSIPHGMDTLQALMGEDGFLNQLNEVFEADHFDMTNEPDLGYPFMYNYTKARSTKTAEMVHKCLKQYFTNQTNGIPGNDDAGTMSAWVVFAMMGIYPDTPGVPAYQVTTPSFEKITLELDPKFYTNSTFVIERDGPKAGAIESITLDGAELGYQLSHKALTAQGKRLIIKTAQTAIN